MAKNNFLIIVEGESDCWTLWYYGYQALGIPGSSMTKIIEKEHISGFETIFTWKEPDKGGELFVSGIAKRLFEIGFLGKAKVLSLKGTKDPSELHIKRPGEFKKTIDYLTMTAPSLPQYVPPVAKIIKRFSTIRGDLTDDQIVRARDFPLEKLLEVKSGTKIICPNHEDQTASLFIKQYGFCFSCGYHVDSIGWLMRKGMKFKQAVEALQND